MAGGQVLTFEQAQATTSASPKAVVETIKEIVRLKASEGAELVASSGFTATIRAPFEANGEIVGSADMAFTATRKAGTTQITCDLTVNLNDGIDPDGGLFSLRELAKQLAPATAEAIAEAAEQMQLG